MRLVAEFTTEPFHGEGEPPLHATKALEALRAAGVDCEFGPLGTSADAEAETLLDALKAAVTAALANGADTVTLQVRRADATARPTSKPAPGSLERILADVADALGGPLSELSREDKQRAVRMLEERGAFAFRKSAETVAEALGVTRFTVYNYLNRTR